MKPKSILAGRVASAIAIVSCTFVLLSWNRDQTSSDISRYPGLNLGSVVPDFAGGRFDDTIPNNRPARDIDEAIEQLDRVDIDATIDQAMKSVKIAMDKIDSKSLQLQVETALKSVDMDKIKKDVEESMAKIDWNQMKLSMDAVKKIDWKEMEKEMKKAQVEIDMKGPEIKLELENARKEIAKAKVELRAYKSFLDGLEKDGLINKKDGYSIKYKNGELNINGKKASDETMKKYRSFLDDHKSFEIEIRDGEFNLNDGSMHHGNDNDNNNDDEDNDDDDVSVIS